MYSLMSILISASSLPNMNSASALASSVLPTPVGPRKMKEPIGRFGSLSPARARRTALETIVDRLVLADDPLVQLVLHLQQALRLLGADPGQRDAGPLADDLGDVLFGHHRAVLARPPRASWLAARSICFLPCASSSRSRAAASKSWSAIASSFSLRDLFEACCASLRLGRRRCVAQPHARPGLVDHVDRLVRQAAAGDVAARQLDGRAAAPRR